MTTGKTTRNVTIWSISSAETGHRKWLCQSWPSGYLDEITQPGEEVFCRCYVTYLYNLRSIPEDMLTQKGRKFPGVHESSIEALKRGYFGSGIMFRQGVRLPDPALG